MFFSILFPQKWVVRIVGEMSNENKKLMSSFNHFPPPDKVLLAAGAISKGLLSRDEVFTAEKVIANYLSR
jgi:hypothetical protein